MRSRREIRRFDSTDTMDSNGSDDGTLIVRKVRRNTKFQGNNATESGFIPKNANQASPVPKENDNSSPSKSTVSTSIDLKNEKLNSPGGNFPTSIAPKGGSSVCSNQSSVTSQAKEIEDPMEPILLPKPSSISVPDIPVSQPRQMIYSLHGNNNNNNSNGSNYVADVNPMSGSTYNNTYNSNPPAMKTVMPVRLASPAAPDTIYVDADYGNINGYNSGYSSGPNSGYNTNLVPARQPSSRDNSRRSSYSNGGNMYQETEYNRVDAFSYDMQQDMNAPSSPRQYSQSVTPAQHSPYYAPDNNHYHSQQNTPNMHANNNSTTSSGQIEYAQNPMLQAKAHRSSLSGSGSVTGTVNSNTMTSPGNSQISGFSGATSHSASTMGYPTQSPVATRNNGSGAIRETAPRPGSPDAQKNDRLRTLVLANMSETEQIRVALLISTQDDKYGTNMFDSLNADDHQELELMLHRGFKHEQALITIFKRKFEPLIATTKTVSRRTSISSNPGGYESENSSVYAPMGGIVSPNSAKPHHSRQSSFVDPRELATLAAQQQQYQHLQQPSPAQPQAYRSSGGREYIGYHPEDDNNSYVQDPSNNYNNSGYNNSSTYEDFDDGRSYTSYNNNNSSYNMDAQSARPSGGTRSHHQRSGSNAQSFVGYIDNYDPVAGIDSMSLNSGALPPAPPPRRLYAAHSTNSMASSTSGTRQSFPYSESSNGPASSANTLPRTRSSYDRSEFATYDQYNTHPSSTGMRNGSYTNGSNYGGDGYDHSPTSFNNNNYNQQYYAQDSSPHDTYGQQQYQQQYDEYDGGYQGGPSPRSNTNGHSGYFSSGNSVVSSTGGTGGGGDKRIAASYSTSNNSNNRGYVGAGGGNNYNYYNR